MRIDQRFCGPGWWTKPRPPERPARAAAPWKPSTWVEPEPSPPSEVSPSASDAQATFCDEATWTLKVARRSVLG